MPFRPSEEIVEACDRMCEEVWRLQRESRPFLGSGHIHEQVAVQTPSGPTKEGRGMAPLLQCIWEFGVDTHMSCEDNNGSVWISFDLYQFMRLHRAARSLDDLAYFVDNCHYTFSCQMPEHAAAECCDAEGEEEDYAARVPPLYHVCLRFPKRLHGTFKRLLDEALLDAEADAVSPVYEEAVDLADLAARREIRAARWAAPSDHPRSHSPSRSRSRSRSRGRRKVADGARCSCCRVPLSRSPSPAGGEVGASSE
jgi:hypothetical protein